MKYLIFILCTMYIGCISTNPIDYRNTDLQSVTYPMYYYYPQAAHQIIGPTYYMEVLTNNKPRWDNFVSEAKKYHPEMDGIACVRGECIRYAPFASETIYYTNLMWGVTFKYIK